MRGVLPTVACHAVSDFLSAGFGFFKKVILLRGDAFRTFPKAL